MQHVTPPTTVGGKSQNLMHHLGKGGLFEEEKNEFEIQTFLQVSRKLYSPKTNKQRI